MNSSGEIRETLLYVTITIVTYIVLQAVTIIAHEFVHSTTAWLLGYMPSPLSIVWGNPVTMHGWDEGVPYDQLFPTPGNPAEAVIGASPLVFHTIVVAVGLFLLQQPGMTQRKWPLHTLYWLVVVSLMELISYIVMRPFALGGDTFHFDHGLALSPWLLSVVGTLLIMVALTFLFIRVLPLLCDVIAPGNRLTDWAILLMTAFILFLWGSGMRAMSTYPDPQWVFGLTGVAAFVAVLLTGSRYVTRHVSMTPEARLTVRSQS
jgi:hypothetical protein